MSCCPTVLDSGVELDRDAVERYRGLLTAGVPCQCFDCKELAMLGTE